MDRHILFILLLTIFFLFTVAIFVAAGEQRLDVYISLFYNRVSCFSGDTSSQEKTCDSFRS